MSHELHHVVCSRGLDDFLSFVPNGVKLGERCAQATNLRQYRLIREELQTRVRNGAHILPGSIDEQHLIHEFSLPVCFKTYSLVCLVAVRLPVY